MTFLWPRMLWLLALLPALVLLYWWLVHRRRKAALRYASLSLVKAAMGSGPAWRRHVPPLLLLLAFTALIVSIARPAAVVTLPMDEKTIILAMDVSGSMSATDVEPTRLIASQTAAKGFVNELPGNVRVGVVSFAGSAAIVQAPTHSRTDVIAAIDRLQLQRATAIGSGILMSLAALFPDAGIDASLISDHRDTAAPLGWTKPKPFTPVAPGSYNSAAIILLTDGQRTTGPDPMDAAKMAADRGVRVYTVGFGTINGEIIGFEGWSMRVRLDEETLKAVAALTRAEYFYAGSAPDLKKVYETLSSRLVLERKETEITAMFAAAGALLAVLAAALSLWWFGRVA